MDGRFHERITFSEVSKPHSYRNLYESLHSMDLESDTLLNISVYHVIKTRVAHCLPEPACFAKISKVLRAGGCRRVLGVNSGLALFETLLAEEDGMSVISTDIKQDGRCMKEMDSVEAARKYCMEACCICSLWPTRTETMLVDAMIKAETMGRPFKYVLYGGEAHGGKTASTKLYIHLGKNYSLVDRYEVFKWKGLNDHLFFFQHSFSCQ